MGFFVMDIGGTNTRLAYSTDGEDFTSVKCKTTNTVDEFLEEIKQQIKDNFADHKADKMICGIRGRLAEDHRSLEKDDRLQKWEGEPLADKIEKAFKLSVFLENDTALAGLGEAVYGAGKEFDYVVYHTISTGVGGVKIEHGKIDEASTGFEPGHQILDIDRTVLGEDITPTLENLVSGTAIENRMGVKPYEIDQEDSLWDTLAEYLGQGLRNSILYWSPEVIILGGSMILGDPKIRIEDVRKYTVEALDGFAEAPFITEASLGDEAGLYGGLAYAKQLV